MSAVTSTNALAKDSTLQDVADAISTIGATSVGNLSALTTTDKTSLVGAVNEVKSGLTNLVRSETVTLSDSMQPGDGATISISNVASTPKIVQIMEPAGGKPLVATNWWVSSGTLTIQITNLSTAAYPGGNVIVNFLG